MASTSEEVERLAEEISAAVDAAVQVQPKLFGDEALVLLDEIREVILSGIVPEASAIELDRKVLDLRARVEACRAIEQLAHTLIEGDA